MKTVILLIPIFVVTLLFGFCQTNYAQSRDSNLPAQSMKGYELYSWKTRGEWYFSLLVGTNRLKTRAEATSAKVRVKGVKDLKKKLNQLSRGEQVVLSARFVPQMTLPPQEIIKEIKAHCEERGIMLLVAGKARAENSIEQPFNSSVK